MNNNNKVLYSIITAVLILALVALGVYAYQQRETDKVNDTDTSNTSADTDKKDSTDEELTNTSFKSENGVAITLSSPTRGATITSPLKVAGNVPGNWSHEGQFSIRLLDDQSKVLAEGEAKLDGDWMTESPVAFSSELTFEAPKAGTMGLLVLEKANPSGLQENADSLTVPIKF